MYDKLTSKILEFCYEVVTEKEEKAAFDKLKQIFPSSAKATLTGFDSDSRLDLEMYDHLIHNTEKPGDVSVLEQFAQKYASLLDESENHMLKAFLTHRFGLWEVQDFSPGEWMIVKDVFSDLTVRSIGAETSKNAHPYGLILGRLDSTQGNGGFTGPALMVPRLKKNKVLAKIKEMAAGSGYQSVSDFVHQYPLKVKELVIRTLSAQKPPLILDWDGYPIKNCEGFYRVKNRDALIKMLSERNDIKISFEDTDDDEIHFALLQKGDSKNKPEPQPDPVVDDELGVLRSGAQFSDPSTGEMYRTIADLEIQKDQLKIFAISEARFDYCRWILEENFKDKIVFLSESRKDFEFDGKLSSASKPERKVHADENDFIPPHHRKKIEEEFMKEHYKRWADDSIPALGGLSPREALKTPAGREKLRDLLKDYISFDPQGFQYRSLKYLFIELGIKPEDLDLKMV